MTRKLTNRRQFLEGVGVCTAGLLAGCLDVFGRSGSSVSNGAANGSSRNGINLGAVGPLSGTYANSGRDERRGIMMAVNERNATGGVNDENVNLVFRDSKADSLTATQHARNLYNNDDIKAMTGIMSSSVSIALADLSQNLQIPFLAVGSATTKVTGENCSPYYFRHYQNSHMNAMSGAQYAADNLGLNWAQISSDYAWGHNIRDIQQEINNENDGTIVDSLLVPFEETDFSSALNKVLSNANEIDVLFFNLFGRDAVNGFKQAVNYGLKDKIDLFVAQQTVSQARALDTTSAIGTYAGLKYWPTITDGSNQDFVQRYLDEHNAPPSSQSWSGYICAREIMDAWERAGSFNPDDAVSQIEGHEYDNIVGNGGKWRVCDHQAVEPVFVAEGNGETIYDDVVDYKILGKKNGNKIMRACGETACSL